MAERHRAEMRMKNEAGWLLDHITEFLIGVEYIQTLSHFISLSFPGLCSSVFAFLKKSQAPVPHQTVPFQSLCFLRRVK